MGNQNKKPSTGEKKERGEFVIEHADRMVEHLAPKLMYQYKSAKWKSKIANELAVFINNREGKLLAAKDKQYSEIKEKLDRLSEAYSNLKKSNRDFVEDNKFMNDQIEVIKKKEVSLMDKIKKITPSKSFGSRLKYLFTGRV